MKKKIKKVKEEKVVITKKDQVDEVLHVINTYSGIIFLAMVFYSTAKHLLAIHNTYYLMTVYSVIIYMITYFYLTFYSERLQIARKRVRVIERVKVAKTGSSKEVSFK